MGILDHFPKGLTPRPVQAAVLREIERRWNQYDVLVINAPVALGKSAIASTIASWQRRARVVTPTNILVDQYSDSGMISCKSAGQFTCTTDSTMNCREVKQMAGGYCTNCTYGKQFQKGKTSPITVSTYHMLVAMRSQRKVHIFDEAHNIVNFLREQHTKKYWPHQQGIPEHCINDWEATREYLESQMELTKDMDTMLSELHDKNPLYIYEYTSGEWKGGGQAWGQQLPRRGEAEVLPLIRRYPIKLTTKHNPLWMPEGNQKLILMSATIGLTDLYELGLDQKRTYYIEAESPIPVENRPITTDYLGKVSRKNMKTILPKLVNKINEQQTRRDKGIIHLPYNLAAAVRKNISSKRFFFHDRTNTMSVLNQFKDSKDGIMIASGLYEGVSLDYDLARWQVIGKVPWPSLASPLQRYWTERNPDYYSWQTIKQLLQASGRVCRRPDDYGSTEIWDETFEKLRGSSLIPKWFTAAVQ